ncbi:hypothetical protein [Niallia sp. NCCP-28]|uniref:hypothetical protein n=1 Tax=Niallia sp. NCCP-28 TaxID=2934712 RepID=UPI0020876EF9|nr:hypothetical protein [Niallia sp. NCCP-28]GKU80852.1 hypothetical protein NCCP28_02480 [Niallia sp. NCCP-28]
MDIQKYYRQTAFASLNASVISCIPIFFLTSFFVSMHLSAKYFLYMLPFAIYSITSYVLYQLDKRRSIEALLENSKEKESSLLEKKTVVLSFLPAPSLRMLIFDCDGVAVGEIRDEKFHLVRWYLPYFLDKLYAKNYGFYSSSGMLQYTFTIKGKTIEIKNKKGKKISKIIEQKMDKPSKSVFTYGENTIIMNKSLAFTDYRFEKANGLPLAILQKGLLPKEWSKRFLKPNIPLLSINHGLSNKEIIHLYALLAKIYAYKDH